MVHAWVDEVEQLSCNWQAWRLLHEHTHNGQYCRLHFRVVCLHALQLVQRDPRSSIVCEVLSFFAGSCTLQALAHLLYKSSLIRSHGLLIHHLFENAEEFMFSGMFGCPSKHLGHEFVVWHENKEQLQWILQWCQIQLHEPSLNPALCPRRSVTLLGIDEIGCRT